MRKSETVTVITVSCEVKDCESEPAVVEIRNEKAKYRNRKTYYSPMGNNHRHFCAKHRKDLYDIYNIPMFSMDVYTIKTGFTAPEDHDHSEIIED